MERRQRWWTATARAAAALLVGLVLMAACSAPARVEDPPTTYPTAMVTVEPSAWVRDVCPQVEAAQKALNVAFAISGSGTKIATLDGRKALRSEIAARLRTAASAVVAADHHIADAGVPKANGGLDVVGMLRGGLAQIASRFRSAAHAVEVAPADNQTEFEDALSNAVSPLDDGGASLAQASRAIHAVPEFQKSLSLTTSCASF